MKKTRLILLLFVFVGGIVGFLSYRQLFAANVPTNLKTDLVQIPTGTNFEELITLLKTQKFIENEGSFRTAATLFGYSTPRAGQFKVKAGGSNFDLVRVLHRRGQTPVALVLHNKRTLAQLAGFFGSQFEADSLAFLEVILDEKFWQEKGYTLETAMSAFIPNTYQIYWTTPPRELLTRLAEEGDAFWQQENRLAKAKAMGFTKAEVYTLASIVETESQYKPERPRIAGVYLNRMAEGMRLQADPTVVFAIGDFSIRRVRSVHTAYDSPYNTYRYAGLPPGPIYMSSISSIDAVLNAEKHDYLYFCAKPDYSSSHNFSKTLDAHLVYARNYQRWLNEEGVK